jgi:hypothetical protein
VSSAQANTDSPGIESEPLRLTVTLEDNHVLRAGDGLESLALEGDDPDIKDSYVFVSGTAIYIAGGGTSHWQHVTKGWKEMIDAVPAV